MATGGEIKELEKTFRIFANKYRLAVVVLLNFELRNSPQSLFMLK